MHFPCVASPSEAARLAADVTRGRWQLAVAAVLLGVLWLGVLPWLGRLPSVESRRQWLDERRIDPSAMFYTELEAMDPILKRLESPADAAETSTDG